jgi:hypothetical protein
MADKRICWWRWRERARVLAKVRLEGSVEHTTYQDSQDSYPEGGMKDLKESFHDLCGVQE